MGETALPYERISAPVGATGLCCAALRLSAQKQLTFPAAAELSLFPAFYSKDKKVVFLNLAKMVSFDYLATIGRSHLFSLWYIF